MQQNFKNGQGRLQESNIPEEKKKDDTSLCCIRSNGTHESSEKTVTGIHSCLNTQCHYLTAVKWLHLSKGTSMELVLPYHVYLQHVQYLRFLTERKSVGLLLSFPFSLISFCIYLSIFLLLYYFLIITLPYLYYLTPSIPFISFSPPMTCDSATLRLPVLINSKLKHLQLHLPSYCS